MEYYKDYGKTDIYIKATGIGIILKLILNFFLIPIKGIYEKGAIISTIITDILICYLIIKQMKTKLNIKIELKNKILKICLSIILSIVLIYKINLYFLIKILCMFIIYVLLIFITKVFSKEELKMLPNGEKLYIFMKKIKIY